MAQDRAVKSTSFSVASVAYFRGIEGYAYDEFGIAMREHPNLWLLAVSPDLFFFLPEFDLSVSTSSAR